MIDTDGFRANVGIVLSNQDNLVFWARRVGMNAWQFPQGGIRRHETPEVAMYRELHEEVGLSRGDVEIVKATKKWLRYRLPKRYIRHDKKPLCIGQKQIWFLLRMVGEDISVRLDESNKPEFDRWEWVHYWHPLEEVIDFKRDVYRRALTEFAPLVNVATHQN